MPSLARRNCSNGCGRTSDGGPCTNCTKQRDARRGTPTARGYDANHRKLRIQCFQRDGWRCIDCGWEPDVIRQCRELQLDEPPLEVILDELRIAKNQNKRHLHGDHNEPIQERPDLRLDLDNYRTRCNECHSSKTIRENNPNLPKELPS